jgi:hypothetical protein
MRLTREEKEKILKALEEDREFRYELMGLLGYREVLERLYSLESRLEVHLSGLSWRFERLERTLSNIEKILARIEERFARLEERLVKLEERFLELHERVVKLDERVAKLEERVLEELSYTRRLMSIIAHRFSVISEEAFREAMKHVVEEIFGVARVSKWRWLDQEGLVYGHPALVEVDVLIRDKEHVLLEVKSRVSRGDVAELYRVGVLYERVVGVKPKLVIVGGFIDRDAHELAEKLGVEIKPAIKEPLVT